MPSNIINEEDSPTISTAYTSDKVVILHLGGAFHRLFATLYLAKKFPDALIIIGSEANPKKVAEFFLYHKIGLGRVIFNYDAWDTVSNFTVTYEIIKKNKTNVLYVVTDLFHMRRSMSIANVAFLFSGIQVRDYASYLGDISKVESNWLVYWDTTRTLLWKMFRLYPKQIHGRMAQILQYKKEAEEIGVL